MSLGLITSGKSLGIINKVDINYGKKDIAINYEIDYTEFKMYSSTHLITLTLNGKLEKEESIFMCNSLLEHKDKELIGILPYSDEVELCIKLSENNEEYVNGFYYNDDLEIYVDIIKL